MHRRWKTPRRRTPRSPGRRIRRQAGSLRQRTYHGIGRARRRARRPRCGAAPHASYARALPVYPKALVGDVEAVHDLRVAARRLRIALVLLADKPDGRRARRAQRTLRDLAAAAGRGRDLDVGIAILDAQPAAVGSGHERLKRALRAIALAGPRPVARGAARPRRRAPAPRPARVRGVHEGRSRDRSRTSLRSSGNVRKRRSSRSSRCGSGGRMPRRSTARGAPPDACATPRRSQDVLDANALRGPDRWRRMQNRARRDPRPPCPGRWLESRRRRADARGDAALATAASRALARVKRDGARRTRDFLAAKVVETPNPSG